MGRAWYAVRTKPRREFEAESNLEAQGFRVWLPKTTRVVRHARRVTEKIVPFFPGYLFVEIDMDAEHWAPIRYTRGV
ncbi:MAG: transcriptional activator RfaH, partial [Zetaproteobacteria bacterium]